jgi:hypothetical protein
MEPNQVRIGNWVIDAPERGYKTIQVERVDTDKDGYSHHIDHCTPILLDDEWLSKFLFHKTNDGVIDYWHFGFNPHTHDWLITITYSQLSATYFYLNAAHDIKFVHELQNLCFALTRIELQIREK